MRINNNIIERFYTINNSIFSRNILSNNFTIKNENSIYKSNFSSYIPSKFINLNKITQKMIINREMIDFNSGIVSFEYGANNFYIEKDGMSIEIPISEVSPIINEDNVKTLEVTNNRLTLSPNTYYKFKHADGIERLYGATNNGFKIIDFVDSIYDESKTSYDQTLFDTVDIINELLRDSSYMIISSKKSINFLANELGFKPGYFEVGMSTGKTNRYFYLDSGRIINDKAFNNQIYCLNSINHLEYGVPRDAKWIIGGIEYKMNEDGYFNLPYLNSGFTSGEFKLVNSEGKEIHLKNPDMVKQSENVK
ncbi:MAG: hypothetical protein E7205_02570 [Tissierellaceae bacterium]|nr:hypothetical protein [Tissierellaceae bacterium]